MQPKQLAGVKLILNTDTAADHEVIFGTSQMLIYLDTMIVQHISDYFDLDCCILGHGRSLHVAMTVCCLANK